MIKVSVQDFNSNWETSEFETRQQVWDYIHSLDMVNAIEIEGVEFENSIPTSDELTEWVNS